MREVVVQAVTGFIAGLAKRQGQRLSLISRDASFYVSSLLHETSSSIPGPWSRAVRGKCAGWPSQGPKREKQPWTDFLQDSQLALSLTRDCELESLHCTSPHSPQAPAPPFKYPRLAVPPTSHQPPRPSSPRQRHTPNHLCHLFQPFQPFQPFQLLPTLPIPTHDPFQPPPTPELAKESSCQAIHPIVARTSGANSLHCLPPGPHSGLVV